MNGYTTNLGQGISLEDLAKRINVGPWIKVGHGKFGKKNSRGAGKFSQIMCKLVWGKNHAIKKLLCWKKSMTKQNVQTLLDVGPRKNSRN